MARITLFRHAKAETPAIQKSDFDRVLSNRGRRNADRMGRFIAKNNLLPDMVIVSPAARTRETHELASVHWPDIPVIYRDSIYEASATNILAAIESLASDAERVMVIGHNRALLCCLATSWRRRRRMPISFISRRVVLRISALMRRPLARLPLKAGG